MFLFCEGLYQHVWKGLQALIVRLHGKKESSWDKPCRGVRDCKARIEQNWHSLMQYRQLPGESHYNSSLWEVPVSRWRIVFDVFSNLPFALLNSFNREHRDTEKQLIRSILMLNQYKALLYSRKRVPNQDDIKFGRK
jgi:hypothetical protein